MSDGIQNNFNGSGKPPRQTPVDARLDAQTLGRLVHAGKANEAFARADAAEAGSQLPMLMALAEDVKTPNGTDAQMQARFPWLGFWYEHDFIKPLFDSSNSGGERFLENTRMTDRAKDDCFIIKAAIVSDQSSAMLSYLLDLGDVDLNTKNDRPLTLAVALGKPTLIPLLAESGADLYAANAEAFRLARAQSSFDVYTELTAAVRNVQRDSQKKLMQRTPNGLTPKALRAGDDETGLHLAAKAGMVRLLLTHDMLADFTADDFLKPSQSGATPAGILAARGEYSVLFDERIWRRNLDEADKVYNALDAYDRAHAFDSYQTLMRARHVDRDIADMQSRWPRLFLPSKPDKP